MAIVQFKVDDDLKLRASSLYEKLGLDLSSALCIFMKQSVIDGKLPFSVDYGSPNETTRAAIMEAEEMEKNPDSCQTFTSINDLMEDLMK